MKPDFIVIGAQKSGTTSLCALLGHHPEIHMCSMKETHFFTYRYDRGWQWYESRFKPKPGEVMIGEGTPSYTCAVQHSETPGRIARHLPQAKLIYIVRHPIRRIESHYVQKVANGRKWSSFEEALRTHEPIIDSSKYWKQVDCYRQHYHDDQILLLFLDDLQSDAGAVLRRCFEFLGVDASVGVDLTDARMNTRKEKMVDGPLLAKVRRWKRWIDVTHAAPRWLIDPVKPLFRKPVSVKPEWTTRTRRWVVDQLVDDSRRFLEHCGMPAEHWDLDED